jgi:hypothetical protein
MQFPNRTLLPKSPFRKGGLFCLSSINALIKSNADFGR